MGEEIHENIRKYLEKIVTPSK
uniref:Uncharacterized protein n=1 Tax=Arundo donax TaxID=35708 RepID=A0A0A9AD07_ARUDO